MPRIQQKARRDALQRRERSLPRTLVDESQLAPMPRIVAAHAPQDEEEDQVSDEASCDAIQGFSRLRTVNVGLRVESRGDSRRQGRK